MVNYELEFVWTAFGAIGITLGSFATTLAVYIATKQLCSLKKE